MNSDLRFADPWWLLAIPLVVGLVWFSCRRRRRGAVLYSDVALLKRLPRTLRQRLRPLLPWLRALALVLLVVALARPQYGLEQFRLRTEGIAIQACIDRSGSMQAVDFAIDGRQVNRLEAVKSVLRDFVVGAGRLRGRPDDLIGLIAFGGYAETKSPLTLDHGMLLQVLQEIEIPQEIVDSRGRVINRRLLEQEMATAIGDALALACDRLQDARAKSKVIILLSDGENTAGVVSPEQAADLARRLGIRVYTIGVGSSGLAPFPGTDAFGRRIRVARQVRLDEPTLRMLAETTGGRYYNAQNTESLEQVYAEIDQLEKSVTEGKQYTQYGELCGRFLAVAVALVLIESVLRATWLRILP
jgi:Ca-activated chloride channel family protein